MDVNGKDNGYDIDYFKYKADIKAMERKVRPRENHVNNILDIQMNHQADAFICECSYEHYLFEGHLSLEELMNHQNHLKAHQLILTHLSDQSRSAAQRLHDQGILDQWNWSIAEDGKIYSFKGSFKPFE